MSYAKGDIIRELADLFHDRYHLPMFVSETATIGSVKKRLRWLEDSLATIKKARADGLPLVGYTWWPLYSLVGWGYRQLGTHSVNYYVLHMGLWNLANEEPDPLQRVETPVAVEYRRVVESGLAKVGPIGER